MLEICLVGRTPAGMFGLEGVFLTRTTNNFASEERREYLVLVREALNTQVASDCRLWDRQRKNLDVNIVDLTVRLLGPSETRPRAEKGRGIMGR